MEIDTSKTYEFRPSMPRLIAGMFVVLLFAAVSVWAIVEEEPAGWLGLIIFGGLLLAGLWRLRRRRQPVLTISPAGFVYAPHSAEVVSWPSVEKMTIQETGRQTGRSKYLTVRLHPGWGRNAQASDSKELNIDVIALPIKFDDFFALMSAFRSAHGRKAEPPA